MTKDAMNQPAAAPFVTEWHVLRRYEKAAAHLAGRQVKIYWENPPAGFDGWAMNENGQPAIMLRPDMGHVKAFEVFTHEIAHVLRDFKSWRPAPKPAPNYHPQKMTGNQVTEYLKEPIEDQAERLARLFRDHAKAHKSPKDEAEGGEVWALLGALLTWKPIENKLFTLSKKG